MDQETKAISIDTDLLAAVIDMCAYVSKLPFALVVLDSASRLKRLHKDTLMHGYNRVLSHCDVSLRKQQEAGEYAVAAECKGQHITMYEVVEALQNAGLNPDTQTHIYLMQNSRRMKWLCV